MYRTIAPLLLASQSPRRRELLGQLGLRFSLTMADIDEFRLEDEAPTDFVSRMAREKAQAAGTNFPEGWILAADTIVVFQDTVLGKPEDKMAAREMLALISGNWHQVLTAFTLYNPSVNRILTRIDCSRVKITALSAAQVNAYVDTGEPLDKAGSYAVQGIGGAFVEAIDGSPTTVIGLPLPLVVDELLNCGIISI